MESHRRRPPPPYTVRMANSLHESSYGYGGKGKTLLPPPPQTGFYGPPQFHHGHLSTSARVGAIDALSSSSSSSPRLWSSVFPNGENASSEFCSETLANRSSSRYGGRSLDLDDPSSRMNFSGVPSSDRIRSSHGNNDYWSETLATNISRYRSASIIIGNGRVGGASLNPAVAIVSPSSCLSASGIPSFGRRGHENSFSNDTLLSISKYGRSLPPTMDDASLHLSVSRIPSIAGRSYGNGFLSETLANIDPNGRKTAMAIADPSLQMPFSGVSSIGGGRSHENEFSNDTLANINFNGRNPAAAIANPFLHMPSSGISSIGGGRSNENSFSNETLANINPNGRNSASAIANPSSSLSFSGIPSIGGRNSHESSFHSGTVIGIDSQRSSRSYSQKDSVMSNGDSFSRFSSPCIGSHSPLSQLSNSFHPNSLDSNSLGSPALPDFSGGKIGSVESFRNSLTNSYEFTNRSAVSFPYQSNPSSTPRFLNRTRYLHSNLGIGATYQNDIPGVLASQEGLFRLGKRVASSLAIDEVQLRRKQTRQSLQIGGRRGVRRSDAELRREMRMLKALYNGKKTKKRRESGWEKIEDSEGEKRQKIPFYKEQCLFDDSDDDYLLVEKNRVVDTNNNNNEGLKSEEEESNGWDIEEEEQVSKSDEESWGYLQEDNNYEITKSAEIVEQSDPIQEAKKAALKPPDTQREAAMLFKRLLSSQANKDEEDGDVDSIDGNELDFDDVHEACFKSREELSFDVFCDMFNEQCELRKLYEDSCNCGVFYCLVCMSYGEKVAKKYPDLVSLVQHSRNILKTKKKAEHRGYSRAICHMMGWDPSRNPLSLKDSTIKPRGCIPPLDDNLTVGEHFQESNDPIKAQSVDVTTQQSNDPIKAQSVDITTQESDDPIKAQSVDVTAQGSSDPIKAQLVDVSTQGTSDPIKVQSVDVTTQGSKDPIRAQSVVVTTAQVNETLVGIIKTVRALKEFLFSGDDHIEDDSCVDDQQDPSTSHYNEGREDLTFDIFLNFLSEHQDLRELYAYHQKNSEGFDCLVCVSSGQKVQERYSNLASLIRHAKTTSKKRTRSEHMGYARAICNILDIDPDKSSFSLGEEGVLSPLRGSTSLHDDHVTSEAPISQDGSIAASSAAADQHE